MKTNTIRLSHKVRNILALSFLLIVVLAIGGYYTLSYFPKLIKALDAQIQEKQTQINALEYVGVQLDETVKKIQDEEIKLASIDKQIVSEVSSANTYRYLNSILTYSGFIKFDMIFTGVENKKSYNQNIYNIKGEGDFNAIHKFLVYLEEGPETYKIRKMHLRGVEGIDLESETYEFIVTFEMDVLALFAQVKDLPKIHRSLSDTKVAQARNPFYPIIKRDLPPNYDELLEAERAELKAIMPNKAFVVDQKKNTHILKEGDAVYLGYVKKIDEQNNRIIFTLDKGGIIEEFALELRFSAEKK